MPTWTDVSAVRLEGAGTPGKFDKSHTHPDTMRECGRLPHSYCLTHRQVSHSCQRVGTTILSFVNEMVLDLPVVQLSTLVSPEEMSREWQLVNATQFASTFSVTRRSTHPYHRNVRWVSEGFAQILTLAPSVKRRSTHPHHRNVCWVSEGIAQILTLWLTALDGTPCINQFNLNKPIFCTHRTFSAFGLLGNKGMHCYNGNSKLHHLEEWYELVIAIDEEGYVPRGYVQDFLKYIWKDLNYLHKTKNSSRPLDALSAKSYVLEITDIVLLSYKETFGQQQRQALDKNMVLMIVMLFRLKEENPDWFDPIEDEVAKPVEYKVRYIDRIIAIKSALPPRKGKGKSRSCASNRAAQEIERNLKIANAKMDLTYKWWAKSLAHPSLLQNHLVSGRHRALERNLSAKTSALAVHDEAVVETTPTPQPQEDDMTVDSTIQPQTAPYKGLFESGIPQILQQRHPGNHKTLSVNGKSLLESIVNGIDITALLCHDKFTRWNHKWKLSTYPTSGGDGSSEPFGKSVAPPNRQSLSEEGVA